MHTINRRILTLVCVVALSITGLTTVMFNARASSPGVSFGSVDLPTWQTNNAVWDLATAQGKVFVGGSFTSLRPPNGSPDSPRNQTGLAVLDAATGAPSSCQFMVEGLSRRVRTIEASADGNTVWIAGEFTSINGVVRLRAAALNVATCSVRTDFNAGSISAEVFDLSVSGNTMYVAGGFTSVAGATRQYFAAVNSTTGALLPWTADAQSYQGAGVNKRGRAVEVSPDGLKVVVGGYFYYVEGEFSHSIAILTSADSDQPEGTLLKTYPQGFIPGNPNATTPDANAPNGTSATHVITSGRGDGRFYIGNEGIGGGIFDGRAAFRWSDGEQIWRDTCLGATQDIIEDNGTLYAAHHVHDCSGINEVQDGRRVYLTAQSAETMGHYGWKPDLNDGTGEGIGPRALTIASTGSARYLWVGGEFTLVNGSAQQGLTRFSDVSAAPGTPAIAPTPMTNGTIQVRLRSVVDNDDSDLTYSVYRNGSTVPVWQGVATSLWWKRPQVTFVDANVNPGQLYTYRVEVTDGVSTRTSGSVGARALAPASDYQAKIISDKPDRLYWNSTSTGVSTDTNAGSWVHDASASTPGGAQRNGIGMRGVTSSSVGAVPGDTTGSLVFDGQDDYVWNDQIAPAPQVYSVEAWFKTTTTSGGKIIGFGNGRPRTNNNATQLSGSYDRHIYMLNNGRVRFGVWSGGATTLTSNQSYNDAEWHHVVATQGSGGMTLWVDGERVSTSGVTSAQAYSGVWHVGGDNLNGWPDRPASNFFAGQIDEVAVYDRVLDRSQIVDHAILGGKQPLVNAPPADAYGVSVFNHQPDLYWRLHDASSVAADASYFGQMPGNYTPGVLHPVEGALVGHQSVELNDAATFSGSNNSTVATAALVSPPSSYSMQLWFKAPTNGRGKLAGFENTPTGNGSGYDKHIYMTDSGRLIFGTYTGSPQTVTSPESYNDDAWHMVTATQDAAGMKLYVDGAMVASNGVTGAETGAGYWRLGGGNLGSWPNSPSNSYFAGQIDEFAIYPAALSGELIQTQYLIVNPDSEAPTVPVDVTALFTAPNVELTWSASTDNVGVVGYTVHRGNTPGFVADEATKIGSVNTNLEAPSFIDEAPGVGTWFYKVQAVDALENRSEASAEASVTVLDDTAPGRPELAATVAAVADVPTPGDSTPDVTLAWAAVADNVGVVAYEVHRGLSADFTVGADSQLSQVLVTDPGQQAWSYVDANPAQGTWFYAVVARDAAGNRSDPSASVEGVIPDTLAPGAPTSVTADVVAGQVELEWAASSDNIGVTSYVIHRSSDAAFEPSAGTAVGSVNALTWTDPAPSGTWYYRVTAVDAAGNVSAGSAAVSVVVLDTTAPTSPVVTVAVNGAQTTLTWSPSQDNTSVAGYRVYRGTSSDVTAETGALLGELTDTSFVDSDLAPGTYYYRVAAFDDALNVSELSAAVMAVVAAPDTEAPTTPAGVAATATADRVDLVWTPSTDNVGVSGYEVHRGTTAGFVVGSSSKLDDVTGTTYQDAGLAPGTYYYAIRAVDAAGNVSLASPVTSASVGSEPVDPVTITLDVTEDSSVIQALPSSNYGKNNQLFARGSGAQEAFIRLALPAAPAGTTLASATLRLRTSTDPTAATADIHTMDLVSGSWSASSLTWNNRPVAVINNLGSIPPISSTNTPFEVSLNTAVMSAGLGQSVTARISGSGTDSLRVWSADAASTSYRPQLVLEFVGGESPADTQPPSVPVNLAATASGRDVTVQWNASSDNVGVTGYEIFRGSSSGFTVDASALIASVSSPGHVDTDLGPGTYYYKVLATDAAGNRSGASVAASATVADSGEPADPVTLESVASADAGIFSTVAGTNYGSNSQLFSSNASSVQQAFLLFDVPAAPPGLALTGVSLRIRTSTDPSAASTGVHDVHVMGGGWTEGSLTWNNRPTTVLANACTISGATKQNTPYTATCDATTFSAGAPVSLRISTSSTDNLRWWSRESSAAYRPTLVLSYS